MMVSSSSRYNIDTSFRHIRYKIYILCCFLLYTTTSQDQQQKQPSCFDTISAINNVMELELSRIQNGASPQDMYMYSLCQNTFLDATTTILQPILNNIIFICGNTGNRLDRCVILGGNEQVRISNSIVDNYPIQELNFIGITFSSFTSGNTTGTTTIGTSINATASATTTVTFTDCAWEEFTSDFVFIQNATGAVLGSNSIVIEQGSISAGTCGVIFDNNAGLLYIENIVVTDITAAAFIATANNGASFLSGMKISLSDVNAVTFTTAGGSQTVTNSSVTLMTRLADTFYVEDEGSTLLLENVIVERNQIQGDPWTVVAARTNAVAEILETTISDNTGLEFGIIALNAMAAIRNSFIRQNTGSVSSGTPSAPVFAITDAQVVIEQVEFENNSDFSGSVVALIRSSVSISRSCWEGGSSEFVVFIANDATYDVSENYVNSYSSERCQATGPRLFQENESSGCFLGSTSCEGVCVVLADQTTCRAQEGPTITPAIPTTSPIAPSIGPMISIVPSVSPILLPTLTSVPTPSPNTIETIIPTTTSPTVIPTIRPSSITLRPSITQVPSLSSIPSIGPSSSVIPTLSMEPSVSLTPTYKTFPPNPKKDDSKKKSMKDKDKCPKGMMMMSKSKDCMTGKGKGGSMRSSKGKGGKGSHEIPTESISPSPMYYTDDDHHTNNSTNIAPYFIPVQPPSGMGGKGKSVGKGGHGGKGMKGMKRWDDTYHLNVEQIRSYTVNITTDPTNHTNISNSTNPTSRSDDTDTMYRHNKTLMYVVIENTDEEKDIAIIEEGTNASTSSKNNIVTQQTKLLNAHTKVNNNHMNHDDDGVDIKLESIPHNDKSNSDDDGVDIKLDMDDIPNNSQSHERRQQQRRSFR